MDIVKCAKPAAFPIAVMAAVCAAVISPSASTAQTARQPAVIVVTPQGRTGTLETLRSQQRRETYQEQQRQSRDADRDMITRSTPRIVVPVMRPTCLPTGKTVV